MWAEKPTAGQILLNSCISKALKGRDVKIDITLSVDITFTLSVVFSIGVL